MSISGVKSYRNYQKYIYSYVKCYVKNKLKKFILAYILRGPTTNNFQGKITYKISVFFKYYLK